MSNLLISDLEKSAVTTSDCSTERCSSQSHIDQFSYIAKQSTWENSNSLKEK